MDEKNDAQSAPKVELRSVDEWCRVVFPRPPSGRENRHLWRHSAAATLHGWQQHEHHTGSPMRLSRADYEAAITAALQPDLTVADYVPHAAALSPHK